MKIALITTTINVPAVLALYRKLGPDVRFFVAGDQKTPDETDEFCSRQDLNINYYSAEHQAEDLGYKCSELIGWNCVERRNIALLEAVKWGAEIIVTIDDDNIPCGNYFLEFQKIFQEPKWVLNGVRLAGAVQHVEIWYGRKFNGLKASSPTRWFDPGELLVPKTKHRGFPIGIKSEPVFESVIDARIGVAQGLCLGDPDIDSVTRIALAPIIHSVSELGRAGIVVDPRETKTVFNTQNTSFIRELAPAMFQPPGVGRYSDIYASLICQRVMRERGLYTHFGMPLVWQSRNKHNLIGDLRQEIDGMENIERFAKMLDGLVFNGLNNTVEDVRHVYRNCQEEPYFPNSAVTAALAFCDDIEGML